MNFGKRQTKTRQLHNKKKGHSINSKQRYRKFLPVPSSKELGIQRCFIHLLVYCFFVFNDASQVIAWIAATTKTYLYRL
jgi:hypothetical protein